jgi:DNA-binding response OmpR family regulator
VRESDGPRPRVLVVDDDHDLRELIRSSLEIAGFDAFDAADGREAMGLFVDRSPDVVVTDIFMPEMDGLELLMKLREFLPRVPVIVISGGGQHRDRTSVRAALALGAVELLTKPCDMNDVVAAVRRALDGASAGTTD